MTTDTTEDALWRGIREAYLRGGLGWVEVEIAVQDLIDYREARLSKHLEVRHNCDNGVEEIRDALWDAIVAHLYHGVDVEDKMRADVQALIDYEVAQYAEVIAAGVALRAQHPDWPLKGSASERWDRALAALKAGANEEE